MIELLDHIADLRATTDRCRAGGGTVGLVPTMGYLHEGHRSLIRIARRECDLVVVSIFVNPLQFGPSEDLDRYPRDLDGDLAACRDEGADVVFAPTAEEMYPHGTPVTTVHVAGLTDSLCGAFRPGHFDGVTTVVTKLLAITGPCRAYFGRKDAQQLAVVDRMVADLDLPVIVVGCPLVREADGLALSSRNAYLGAADRRAAPALYRALFAAAGEARAGERDARRLVATARRILDGEPRITIEYLECVDTETLRPIEHLVSGALLAAAVRLGATRLIDNVVLESEPVG